MIQPAFEILNQRGTPMFFSDVYANIPTAGIVGRIFISTDTKEFYRDTGTTWELLAGPGGGTITGSGTATQVAFFNGLSTITSDTGLYWDNTNKRLGIGTQTPGVSLDIHGSNIIQQLNGTGTTNSQLAFQNAGTSKWQLGNIYAAARNYFRIYDTASASDRLTIDNTGIIQITGYSNLTDTRTYSTGTIQSSTIDKRLTIPNAASISSSVTLSSLLVGGTTTFQGSVTIPNTTTLANNLVSNSFSFSSAGTITMTQAAGIRAASSNQILSYFGGTASSTISHYAASSIYGFFNLNSGSITPIITNAYMHLINDMNDYSHTFTFTNRWGIYQAGANDKNYFSGKILAGTTTDAGSYQIQVTGQIRLNSYTTSTSYVGIAAGYLAFDSSGNIITTAAPTSANIYNSDGTLTSDRTLTSGGFNLTFTGTNNAATGLARLLNMSPTLVATANSDVLVGLDINPTFTNGAFTSVSNAALRIGGQLYIGQGKASVATNIVIGSLLSGRGITTGNNNVIIGSNSAGGTLSSGSNNTFVGSGSGFSASSASGNTGIGQGALNGTNGSNNTAVGSGSQNTGTTSASGTSIGVNSLQSITSGNANTAIGMNSLLPLTTGANNIALGFQAGRYATASGTATNNTTGAGNVFIGYDTRPLANADTNEIVISGYTGSGDGRAGLGSNTTVIGNASTTFTGITAGNLSIGTSTNSGNRLYVNGSVRIDGQTAGTAGAAAALFLIVNLDGVNYKIALLNV